MILSFHGIFQDSATIAAALDAMRTGYVFVMLPILAAALMAPGLPGAPPRGAPLTFVVTMSGAQVVPPRTTAASGFAQFALDRETNRLDFTILLFGTSPAEIAGAELRQGWSGTEGSLVLMLAAGGWTQTSGRVTLSADQMSMLMSGNIYVEIRSVSPSAPLIRGQALPPGVPVSPPTPTPTVAATAVASPSPVAEVSGAQSAAPRITPPSTGEAGLR